MWQAVVHLQTGMPCCFVLWFPKTGSTFSHCHLDRRHYRHSRVVYDAGLMKSRLFIVLLLLSALAACGSAPSWQDRQEVHIVRKGETLFSIASRYDKKPSEITLHSSPPSLRTTGDQLSRTQAVSTGSP